MKTENGSIYEHLIIFYFSGTGNARSVSRWIAEIARKQTMHGIFALIWYAASILAALVFGYVPELKIITSETFFASLFDFVVWTLLFLCLSFAGYRIIHFLMRYKIVNRIVKYSSLTSYAFWRRYKVPKQKKHE